MAAGVTPAVGAVAAPLGDEAEGEEAGAGGGVFLEDLGAGADDGPVAVTASFCPLLQWVGMVQM